MRYHVLATDYDGTIATDGRVDAPTLDALKKLIATGRRLVLVTGRELPELLQTFPEIDLFEWVVAENGALLYRPSTKEEKLLADPPPEKFIEALRQKNVAPMSVGRAIIATWEPHQTAVLETIRELGLEFQVIFNKGAVMVLPAGVNKATGLLAALKEMGLSEHNAVGVGDAENDHAFLRLCEFSAAVSNALAAVMETADLVTTGARGAGVSELIQRMVDNDLVDLDRRIERHYLPFGTSDGIDISIPPYGKSILICGPSASGKSTVTTRIVESLVEKKYQFCLIDPEGDYREFEGAVVFGSPKSPPPEDEILRLLETSGGNAVVCMTGMPIPDRPPFFLRLLSQLLQLRSRTGLPHWLILDEAHHLMPAEWLPPNGTLPPELYSVLLVTVHPELLSNSLLGRIHTVLAVGTNAATTLSDFAKLSQVELPVFEPGVLEPGELLMWSRDDSGPPRRVRAHPCVMERHRHSRKYAEGQLPPDRSFYFRGPKGQLKLRAQNLMLFLQIGDGVDDATWDYHLQEGDYARWFREVIKDENLAASAERIAGLPGLTPLESRELIRAAVERDYTVPASLPLPVPNAS
ncbi:MAG: yidA [Planctomycetaceae bacterium]|nr:yidA [Planctomycetaceae bacterium]